MIFRGEYSNEVQYTKLDVVSYEGSSYVCLIDCIGIEVTNTEYWQMVSQKGDKGDKGDMPTNGVDYNTEEQKQEFMEELVASSKTEIDNYATEKVTEVTDNAIEEFNQNAVDQTNTFNSIANIYKEEVNLLANELQTGVEEGEGVQITNSAEYYFDIQPQGKTYQEGEANPNSPVEIENVSGDIAITVANEDLGKSQTATFPLEGQKLMEGSYLAEDGIHNKRKQIVLNGSENWILYKTLNNGFSYVLNNWVNSTDIEHNYTDKENYYKCSHFKFANTDIETMENGLFVVHKLKTNSWILFTSDISTLAEFKTWLASNPVTVEYELEEEEIIPYTEEQQLAWNNIELLKTYLGVTNISIKTDNIQPSMKVEYKISTKILLAELGAKIEELEQAIANLTKG